jgi:hypothetical protein
VREESGIFLTDIYIISMDEEAQAELETEPKQHLLPFSIQRRVPSLRYGLSLDQDSLEEKKFPENRRWNLREVFLVHYNLLLWRRGEIGRK